jgi:hypothetical protein
MTWAMTVGVNGGQWWVRKWAMMWAMMWATGMIAAMTPAMTLAKGMVEMPARRGGGLLAEDAAAAVAAAAEAAAMTVAAYCRGRLLFIVKIFLSGIFKMWGGNWQGHTSPHTLDMREVCRHTFGWDGNCPQKLWYVNTKNYPAKKHGDRSW